MGNGDPVMMLIFINILLLRAKRAGLYVIWLLWDGLAFFTKEEEY